MNFPIKFVLRKKHKGNSAANFWLDKYEQEIKLAGVLNCTYFKLLKGEDKISWL